MKSILMLAIGILLPAIGSAANVEQTQRRYKQVVIRQNEPKSVIIRLKTEVVTTDACNKFVLTGDLKAVGTFANRIVQTYVADFAVMQTDMACPDGPERTLKLESNDIKIDPQYDQVYARIILPENMEMVVISK